MTKQQAIQFFEQKQVRTVWDNEQENGVLLLLMLLAFWLKVLMAHSIVISGNKD